MSIIIKRIPKNIIKIPLPDTWQETGYSCGAAVLQSILNYYAKGPIGERKVGCELNMTENGTDPYQIVKVLKKYKLKYKEFRPMTTEQLKKCIDEKKTVMIMLQAWGWKIKNINKYERSWKHGHWITAIGYDSNNFYFEDPSLNKTRGFIPIDKLDYRWHDWENQSLTSKRITTYNYGIAIWGNKIREKGSGLRARMIR
ncbi:MAG TPA: C39 family peptidase [Ignavibacteria bacterium]|nr:C39 family peptidase [Ignavibacteria bacterium]